MDADLILRNATIIDGTGSEPFHGNIAISRDRIVGVGDLGASRAKEEIDIANDVVCPGFIDIHTHSDVTLLLDPAGESKVRQGVTTEVTGNCSISPFPLASSHLKLHQSHLQWIDYNDRLPLTWKGLDGYANRLADNPPSLNVAPLVGHGTVRVAVMGIGQREPTRDELARMTRLTTEALDDGAFGFSTGLTVVPSAYADQTEVSAFLAVVADYDALYATHCREHVGEGFSGAEEAIDAAHDSGARLQFSHAAINEPSKWGRADDLLRIFEKALERGVDVSFDIYPYNASSSALIQHLPLWVQAGGADAMRQRMLNRHERMRAVREIANGFMGGIPWLWDRVVISRTGLVNEPYIGLTMQQATAESGRYPEEFALDLCLTYGNDVHIVLFYRDDDDVSRFMSHELSVFGSDGLAMPFDQRGLKPHPRSFGTYPRILGRYVREHQLLSIHDAVHKATGAVAKRLGIDDRGVLRPGAFADLVVFNPESIIDTATFTEPTSPPIGISHVVINGKFVVENGMQTKTRPGRLLRRT